MSPPPSAWLRAEGLDVMALPTRAQDLSLHLAPGSSSGYKGVWLSGKKSKPFMAVAGVGKASRSLGKYASAVDAAVAYAKHLTDPRDALAWKELCASRLVAQREEEAARRREELAAAARRRGRAVEAAGEALVLSGSNKTGYQGVQLDERKKSKRYRVEVEVKGVKVSLGRFETAVDGAVAYARHHKEQLRKEAKLDAKRRRVAGA